MQIFIIANLEVDLVYNKKDDSLSKMDPLSRTLEKRVIKKLLKADFCIVQESAVLIPIVTVIIAIVYIIIDYFLHIFKPPSLMLSPDGYFPLDNRSLLLPLATLLSIMFTFLANERQHVHNDVHRGLAHRSQLLER